LQEREIKKKRREGRRKAVAAEPEQYQLFEHEEYSYRSFVINMTTISRLWTPSDGS